MKIPESMEVGNIQVGEIVKKYDINASDKPTDIIFKTTEDKALTMGLNEDKTLIQIGVYNTTLNDEDIKCTLTKTQLQETIRDLKQLFNQLD